MGPDRPDQVDFQRGFTTPLLRTVFPLLPFLRKEFSSGLSQPEHEIWWEEGVQIRKIIFYFFLLFFCLEGKTGPGEAQNSSKVLALQKLWKPLVGLETVNMP